ncbi:MAG: aspartate aminotransferase family protein [Bacteroidales bacterium]|nr:aspartate aminotransferase family protein [Bacteroidales bacterium]
MSSHLIPFFKNTNIQIVKAIGCYLFDIDGKKYLDLESGDWAANLGHSRTEIIEVLKEQAEILIHDGLRFYNDKSEALSSKLLEKLGLPGGKSTFLNSGSEAVNLGLTMARNLTGRKKILKMDCSFLSSFGYGKIADDNSDLLNIPMNDFSALSSVNFNELAAFAFEPGNAHGLIKFPSNDFIETIASTVKENGGLLLANEVTTGFGRTGRWFGFQHYNFKPDIVCTGKALGNGYPVSGVSVSESIAGLFDKNPFRHAQSHQNDALGCAVALAVIHLFETSGIVEQSAENGNYFLEKLKALQQTQPTTIKEVRGRGMMLAAELDEKIQIGGIDNKLLDRGFVTGVKNNVLRFMPPLIIKREEIDHLVGTLEDLMV